MAAIDLPYSTQGSSPLRRFCVQLILDKFTNLWHPESPFYGYVALMLLCYLRFSHIYCYNIITGLEHTILQVMDIDHTQYGVLYSANMWPNVLMPLVGGLLIDRVIGMRLGLLLVVLTIFISQVLTSLGAFINTFWVMILGQLILGLGTEIVIATIYSFVSVWFKNNVAFALAIVNTCSRIEGTLALSLSQYNYDILKFIGDDEHYRLGLTLSSGTILMGIALICSCAIAIMDWRKENRMETDCESSRKKIVLKDLKDFSLGFWLILIVLSLYYGTILTFVGYGQVLFVSKFQLSIAQANLANSLLHFGGIFINIFIGKLIDLYGSHLIWCMVGLILHIISFIIVIIFNQSFIPFIVGLINAFGYVCFATSVWSMVPRIVQEHQLNTAYGILHCVWLSPFIALSSGAIIDSNGYLVQEIYSLVLLHLALLCIVPLTELNVMRYK